MLWVGLILGNISQKNSGICPPDLIAQVSLVVLGSKQILQGYSEISLFTQVSVFQEGKKFGGFYFFSLTLTLA